MRSLIPTPHPAPASGTALPRMAVNWWPFALGLMGMATLVLVLALQMVETERQRRSQWAVETATTLARLAAAHVAQIISDAADGVGAFRQADVVARPDGGWVLALTEGVPPAGLAPPPTGERLRAVIPVERFSVPLSLAALGSEGAATVRTTDLRLVQRHSNAAANSTPPYGSRTTSEELMAELQRQPEAGHYVAVTAIDGIRRVNAFHRVANAPLIVLVGLPERHAPVGPSRFDLPIIALAALTLLVAGVATFWIYRLSLQRMGDTQRRYQSIVENSEDAIISKSIDGRITSWNAAAERMFGWTAQEIVGRSVQQLVPPDLQVEEASIIHRLKQGQRIDGLETERLHKDGHRIPVAVTISPLRDAQGQITGASKIARDISRQKQLEAEVLTMALHDPLTQLPNRRLFADRLEQMQRATHRSGQWNVLLYLDLDGFKPINDRYGHDVGDECLRTVAQRLQALARESDTVARMGGDEFVMLWRGYGFEASVAERQAQEFLHRVSAAVRRPMALSVGVLEVEASIGWVVFSGESPSSQELLREADYRMYAVKQLRSSAQG